MSKSLDALTAATLPLAGTELTYVAQGGNSRQTPVSSFYIPGGTDVAVLDGGTGASTASGARTNLGLVIGTDVQAFSANLTSWAAITRALGADTFFTTPTSANLRALLTDEVGTGAAYFVNGALGTPASGTATNLTGLPVSTGISGLAANMATFLAGGTSAQLIAAMTDETGTGALVFANGPTLIAPLLGTPASGVATNLTGLPLTTGVTGQLPIANGGTGQATKAAGYDALSPTTTWGDVEFRGTGGNVRLAAGPAGYLYQTNGAGADPSWAGFLQAGTSAVTRTWQNKARDWVSVKDFGAVGDGVTNDTTAIQAAIDAVSVAGGIVFFPNGTYLITAALNVTANSVFLVGASFAASIISYSGATIDGVYFNGGAGKSGGGIRNLSVFATGATKTAGSAVRVANWNDFRIENFSIFSPFIGIRATDCFFFYAGNGNIITPVASTGRGVLCDSVTYTAASHIFNNVIAQGATGGNQNLYGFEVQYSGGTWFYACQAINAQIGLYLNAQAGHVVEHIWSFGSAWDTNTSHGVYINSPSTATIRRAFFIGDWTASNTQTGVISTGPGTIDDIAFIGHRSYQNGQQGFNLNGANNVKIHDCTAAGNSATTINTADGIAVNGSNISIKNTRSGNAAGFGAQQRYGVLLNGTNTYVHVDGNDLTGNATGPINNGMTSTTSRIESNMGYNPVGAASVTTAASPYTYTAGPSPETVYTSATTSITAATQGGVSILPAALGANVPLCIQLEPNETVVLTYTGTLAARKMIH